MSPMVPEVSPELLAGFLDEAPEYLAILDEGLMAFESKAGSEAISLDAPEDHARMNEMFRAAHSLKGLGAAMGFTKIRDLTHLMETLFDQLRMGKRQLESESIETLFKTFDKLKELVQELSETPAEPVVIDDALALLQAILDSQPAVSGHTTTAPASHAATVAATEPSHTPPETKTPQPPTESTCAVNATASDSVLNNPELAKLFVETTLETLDGLNQALLMLESSPADAELINSVFRFAHNIKGASGAAGCQALYRLTHDMESVLDLVRGGKVGLCESLMTTVFAAADRIRADVNLIKDGRAAELTTQGTTGLFAKWLGDGDAMVTPEIDNNVAVQEPVSESGSVEAPDSMDASRAQWVTVTFPKGHPEASIQAYLVFNKLNELGEVLDTTPDVNAIDPAGELNEVTYQVKTSTSAEEIQKVVSMYVIEKVAVSGGPAAVASALPSSTTPVPNVTESNLPGQPDSGASAPSGGAPASEHKPSSEPGPRPATSTAAKPTTTDPAKSAPKAGETIRVDLERLDQLMNLGGELVINKARLVQIQSRFGPLFQEQNLGYLVNDISDRLVRLQQDITKVNATASDARLVSNLSDTMLSLTQDFGSVRSVLQRIHECRPAMNDFGEALHSLNRVSEGIQKRIMETRMVAIGPLFQRFRRVIRDISKATGKNVELVLHGEATELDKRMIDELGDPLTHMIRNSVDHGIELPEDRIKAGKPATATVTLNAYHRGRHICIEVKDDGRGVNIEAVKRKILERQMATQAEVDRMSEKELVQYIFKPGFSTAEKVTDLSGRGMGMDIVMNKLDAINGTVEVESVTGVGCTVTIKLPLTLAIITAIIARIGGGVYALPLETVAEIITVPQKDIQRIQRRQVIRVRDRVIPVAHFEQIFQCGAAELYTRCKQDANITLVILGVQNDRIGLVVDDLIGQEDVVIKSVADNFRNVAGITGASIMGDGSVSLILDVASMMNMLTSRGDAAFHEDAANAQTQQADEAVVETEVLDAVAS